MITLSFGYQLPETNDKGPVVFPALESNIQQLNDHNHDGSNSAKIPSSSIEPLSIDLNAGDWVADVNGLFKQTVALPSALAFDNTAFQVQLPNGDVVVPSINKISNAQYDIFTNDPTTGFKVLYL